MGYYFVLSVSCLILFSLDRGQRFTLGNHDEEDAFNIVMKVPGVTSIIKKMAMGSMSKVKEEDTMFFKAGVDTMDTTSTTAMKAMFTNTQQRAREMGEFARSSNLFLSELSGLFNIPRSRMAKSVNKLLNELGVEVQGLGTRDDNCDDSDMFRCNASTRFRTLDGTCNNIRKPIWGANFIPFRRFLRPVYDDDVSLPRMKGKDGGELPSARGVSLTVHETDRRDRGSVGTSHMVMQWGQFIDHDITSTPASTGARGSAARCCMEDLSDASKSAINMNPEDRDICFAIKLPDNDPQFSPKRCLNFLRSIQVQNTECEQAPVEQMNQITAFIDGSMVYGSSDAEMRGLRTFKRGLMKTSRNGLLPENRQPSCLKNKRTDFCFKAGDARVNEQMGLATLHVMWMREHNRMARELKRLNPKWKDKKLFLETRKIVGAKLQHITYNEFLPLVLSEGFRNQFDLKSSERGFEDIYDENADPSIRNAFASAAYRFGHSMVRTMFSQLDHNYRRMEGLRLQSSFGNTSHLIDDDGDGVNRYIRGLVTDRANRNDRFMSPQVTQHLFQDRAGNSLDLAALNIQRGRDHGLPGYNEWRKWCNLPVARTFSRTRNGLSHHPQHAVTRLRRVYRHPDDIDLFAGGISEIRVRGSLVGPTFSCILAHQFKALKVGDRFWYERDNSNTGFTANQLDIIKQTTLSQVICDNTDIQTMQPNAFKTVGRRNRRQPCSGLAQARLTPWSDDPEVRGSVNRNNDNTVFDNRNNANTVFDNRNNGITDNGNDFGNDNNPFDNGNDFDNGNRDFDNGNNFENTNGDFNNRDGFGNVNDNSDNGNDFDNGNDDFDNRNDFGNENDDFNNRNDFNGGNRNADNDNDFDNGNDDFIDDDFDNGNSNFDNGNNNFDDGNNNFDNGNTNFDNGNTNFDDGNNNFDDGNNNFDNGNNNFDNGNNNFDNGNNNFDNGNNNFDDDNTNFDSGNNNFDNGNNNFNDGNTNFDNGNNNFDNGNTNFDNGNNNFDNGNTNFDNGNNNFDNGNTNFDNGNTNFDNGNNNFDDSRNRNNRFNNGNNGLNDNNRGSSVVTSWGEWNICIGGRNVRKRLCTTRIQCIRARFQTRKCGINTWSDWLQWSSCTNGRQTRKRRCTALNLNCQGTNIDRRRC